MTLAVGDKVVVFNAGTDYSRAVKIEPVAVGDKVTVVTLSDGTKIPLPRVELSTTDYVFVIPTWDLPFKIGGDISWELMPLGAAVFTITKILDCWSVADENREWGDGFPLAGCLLIMVSGKNRGVRYIISSHFQHVYYLSLNPSFPAPGYSDYIVIGSEGDHTESLGLYSSIYCAGSWLYQSSCYIESPIYTIIGAGAVTISYRFAYRYGCFARIYVNGILYVLTDTYVGASTKYTAAELAALGLTGAVINPKYPEYDEYTFDFPITFNGKINIQVHANWVTDAWIKFDFGPLKFQDSDCITEGLFAGDNYVIYNPVTKRLVFNDASKTVLSSAYWGDIVTAGEEISIGPIEYIWDGQGKVYLSQSKTTLSTIMFDDLLKITAVNGTTTRTIDYHAGESVTVSGVTVQRELTDITSILRAGKNQVTIYAKDTNGGKVGWPTPVYIARSL